MAALSATASGGFLADETHRIALAPGNRLIAHSEGLGWRDVYVSIASERSWRGTLQPLGHCCLAYCMGRSATIRRVVEGERMAQPALLRPRQFGSIPAHAPSHWQVDGAFDVALIYLRHAMVREVARALFGMDPGTIDIQPAIGVFDPLLEQLVLAVVAALRQPDGSANGLYIDHLATTMAAHLLRRHAARPAEPVVPARAPVVDIGLWRARDYIEQHLEGDLGLDVLAREAGISPALFTQRFTEAHGDTPHRYVVRRRLERARGLLAGSDLPIAEVALRAGFSSQSHLSEVFRRSTGETPGAFRRAARSAVAVPVGASWPRAEPGGSRMAGA